MTKVARSQLIMETIKDELGYHVHHRVIDAKPFVPQHRERVFYRGIPRKVRLQLVGSDATSAR